MGDDLYAHMIKGPVHTAIEVCVNDMARRPRFLQALKALPADQDCIPAFVSILRDIAQVADRAAYYLETEWLTWWAEKPSREPIIRHGIIRAIEEANRISPFFPVVFYWMGVGPRESYHAHPDAYPFETIVSRSPWQVTCLLVTPPSPNPPSNEYLDRLKGRAKIWTVKAQGTRPLERGETQVVAHGNGVTTTQAWALPPLDSMQSLAARAYLEAVNATGAQESESTAGEFRGV